MSTTGDAAVAQVIVDVLIGFVLHFVDPMPAGTPARDVQPRLDARPSTIEPVNLPGRRPTRMTRCSVDLAGGAVCPAAGSELRPPAAALSMVGASAVASLRRWRARAARRGVTRRLGSLRAGSHGARWPVRRGGAGALAASLRAASRRGSAFGSPADCGAAVGGSPRRFDRCRRACGVVRRGGRRRCRVGLAGASTAVGARLPANSAATGISPARGGSFVEDQRRRPDGRSGDCVGRLARGGRLAFVGFCAGHCRLVAGAPVRLADWHDRGSRRSWSCSPSDRDGASKCRGGEPKNETNAKQLAAMPNAVNALIVAGPNSIAPGQQHAGNHKHRAQRNEHPCRQARGMLRLTVDASILIVPRHLDWRANRRSPRSSCRTSDAVPAACPSAPIAAARPPRREIGDRAGCDVRGAACRRESANRRRPHRYPNAKQVTWPCDSSAACRTPRSCWRAQKG